MARTDERPAKRRPGLRAALESVLPRGRFGDQRDILGGAGQNVIGLGAGVLATFATQIVMTRSLGASIFGVVTVATQFAFIASTATRFGMDVANVRLVAILVGRGEHGRVRPLVRTSAVIATVVSVVLAVLVFFLAGWLGRTLTSRPDQGKEQPVGWILIAVVGWVVAKNAGVTTLAYALSWVAACFFAWWAWERETRGFDATTEGGGIPEERTGALMRFGMLRAPATLFSQMLFWTDLFVLANYRPSHQVGVYGATVRTGQSLLLFLTSLSLVFSPFVADLHHRGEREKLDQLYKNVTRWGLATTMPILLALAILPGTIMRVYGPDFVAGKDALEILIIGLIVPVVVGTVGFILIMVGRTGWDLLVYALSFVLAVGVAVWLSPKYGMRGAAIAEAVTLTASAVARLLLVHHFVKIWPFDRHFLRLLAPTVAGGVAMAATHAALSGPKWLLDLGGSVVAGTVVYGVVLVAVGLKPGERRAALSLVRRVVGRSPQPTS